MLQYDFFYGARHNIYLTFDYPREVEGELQGPVRFQRLRPGRDLDDIAETVAPACSEGVSPAEFIRIAVRRTIGEVKSGDESFIAMLREEG